MATPLRHFLPLHNVVPCHPLRVHKTSHSFHLAQLLVIVKRDQEQEARQHGYLFFCNKTGHVFTDCEGWKESIKEDANNKYLCVKCHLGRHNARNCRRPGGFFRDSPHKPEKGGCHGCPFPSTSERASDQERQPEQQQEPR